MSSNLVCVNDGRVVGQEGHTDSVIDLAHVSPTLVAQSRRNVLGHYGSVHFHCIILIEKKKIRTREHVEKIHAFLHTTNWQDTQ